VCVCVCVVIIIIIIPDQPSLLVSYPV